MVDSFRNVSAEMVQQSLPWSWTSFGFLFMLVSPKSTSFRKMDEVPDYFTEVIPYVITILAIEQCIAFFRNKPMMRISDGCTSFSSGIGFQLIRAITSGLHYAFFSYIYNNWRLISLPWDSLSTWWICFFVYDFFYYWFHRACHEINIFWATHYVHHNSEDFNLSTGARIPVLQHYVGWIIFIPMALILPPSGIYCHLQLNLIFQFWLHTEVIGDLGLLEYVINTPSHHRVHHGRNRKYIDKNYGGVLIIWDRIFGTFEKEAEVPVYGTTVPISTFQALPVQFNQFVTIWKTFWTIKGIKNKLSVIFKGPGWSPGKPWCGNRDDIPDVHYPVEKYEVQLSTWFSIYTLFHLSMIIMGHVYVMEFYKVLSLTTKWSSIFFYLFSIHTFGALLDGKWSYATSLEFFRCVLFIILDYYILPLTHICTFGLCVSPFFSKLLKTIFFISALFWGLISFKIFSVNFTSKKIT